MADLASRITKPAEGGDGAENAQTDGTAIEAGGPGLVENTYDVEVKLGDLQQNPDSTLYSAKSFQEMNL